MSYTHITIEERVCIALYMKKGLNQTEIANLIGRNKSSISRELSRNESRDEGYNAIGAQRKYNKRRKKCVKKNKLMHNECLYSNVLDGLEKYWSPEQIVKSQSLEISVSTVYRGLKSGMFPKETQEKLRRYGKLLKRKKKTYKGYDFSKVRTIDKRPECVEKRARYGGWELDTVVLRNECGCHLATFVERKSRNVLIRKIPDKKAGTMADAIVAAMCKLPRNKRKTLTVDRGLEFADWQRIEQALKVKVYFCDPYSPSQRGTNENMNGLVRQFFPRRKLLPPITDEEVAKVQYLLNTRPRKCLNWKSPCQSFCCT